MGWNTPASLDALAALEELVAWALDINMLSVLFFPTLSETLASPGPSAGPGEGAVMGDDADSRFLIRHAPCRVFAASRRFT
jgi:hypothetical protein